MAMQITFSQASKRFTNNWVFKNLNYTIAANSAWSITGANGSGKSTLLQIAMGYTSLTAGSVNWQLQNSVINADDLYKYISFCSPAMQLLHEFTALEMLAFHHKLKPLSQNNFNAILESVALQKAKNQFIKNFSSGMVQRLKLALAFYTNSPLLLLDEPTANLDLEGKAIYQNLIKEQLGKRTILIASNDVEEYSFCNNNIAIN